MELKCSIVSPEKEVLRETIDYIDAPGSAGYFGVLPMHAPLITVLDTGIITVKKGRKERKFAVVDGYFEVEDNSVTVIASEIYSREDINEQEVQSKFEEYKGKLSGMKLDDPEYGETKKITAKYETLLKLVR